MNERIAKVVSQVARLEEVGPDAGTLDALEDATGYEREELKILLAEAHNEGRVFYDITRHVWTIRF